MKISFGGFLTSTMIRLATRFGPKPIRTESGSTTLRGLILEQIGIEIQETDENCLEGILQRFGCVFPRTRDFSAFARESVQGSANEDPDGMIMVMDGT